MSERNKISVILILTVAIIGILLYPETNLFQKKKFEVTENPLTVYNQGIKNGKPIYLEFYTTW